MAADRKHVVEFYLINEPKTRDNDNFLLSRIWNLEMYGRGLDTSNFLSEFAKGKFTSAETIVRHRRKLQELNPELRGEKYKLRKEKLEQKYREEFSPKNN